MKKAKLFSAGIFALCQFLYFSVEAQQGKDGAGNINVAGTIVNPTFTRLIANGVAGQTFVKVNNTAGFAAGDLVFIIQMYGADVNAVTDPFNMNNSLPNDTSYGHVINYNNVGNNEFAEVHDVPDATTLNLDCQLKNNYTGVKKVQVIRVPRYTSLTVTAPGTITCAAWNGVNGGVVVVEVQGNTVINAGATIDASGLGYRGGVRKVDVGYGASNTGSWWPDNGAVKGESIVGDTTYYHNTFSGSLCKANVANGGGGGDAMNCGGGGGSNGGVIANWNGMGNPDNSTANNITSWGKEPAWPGVNGSFRPTASSGGGRGGYSFSSNSSVASANPTITGPNNNAVWGSDDRHNDGGWGGMPLNYSNGRMYMGGGGGAGDDNDGNGTAGGNGGGIIYLMSYGTVTGAGQIISNGAAAINTNWNVSFGKCGDDGEGGGGGGGAVFVNSVGAITLTNATPISAVGGKGGNYQYHCVSTTQDFGPGGGGGGGYVGTSNAVTNNVAGGANGICVLGGGNNSQIAQKFPPNGATSGGAGSSAAITNFYLIPTNYTICAGSTASLSVTIGGTPPGGISIDWYNVSTGGAIIFTGNPYVTGALAVGTYTYYVGTCPGTYRAPVVVTVLNAPAVTAVSNPTVICAGQTSILTGSGATSYTWSANAGSVTTTTASVSPVTNTVYTVTGANGTCISTATVAVNVNTAPTLTTTATPTVICAGQSAILTSSGAATYTWSANAGSVTTATASVSPIVNTTYTVTGGNGTCTSTQTVAVAVNTAPTLTTTATPTVICAGQSAILTSSGATTYTWSANAGSVTTATASVSPIVNTTYTVTGANGTCTSTQTVAVAVNTAPTLTTTATPTVICAGQSAILTSSGATTYTWSANAGSVTTATASVSPVINTTYTVTGDNAGCTSTQTVAVNVNAIPTLTTTATPTVICAGQSAILTASGATSYTWSANAGSVTTATATVFPVTNTTYTVTGDNAGCTATQTVLVTVTAPPTLTITATPATICNGQSSVLTGSGATSYTWSANAGGVNTSTVSVAPTSTTSYTLTGDNGGCISTQVISVTINAGPNKADSVSNAASCNQSNGSYQLNSVTGGAGPYQINFNNTGLTTISSFTYTVPNLAAGIYPVVIQDNNGCTYTTSVIIGNAGGITKVDSTTSSASCNPSNNGLIVLNSVTGGTGPYQVSVNGSGFTAASFPDSLKNLTAGVYTVTVKDNTGCLHTSLINVGSIGGITQVNSTTNNTACIPASSGVIVLTSVTGGTGPYQVSVNGGGLINITSFPDSLKNLAAGSYTVLIQDASGCTNTQIINVGTQTGPTAATDAMVSDTCNKNIGTLTVTNVTGGAPAYQYSLNGGTLQASNTFGGLASGNYTITIQDNNGCTFSITDSVKLAGAIPSPTVTAIGNATFCQGGSVILSSSSASGNIWSTGATTQTITVNTAGVYADTVSISGCKAFSNTITVTVNPTPTITVNSSTICNGNSTPLTVSGASTYTWSPTTGISSPNSGTVTANPSATTVYTINATDANGCTTSNTSTVTVNPTPVAVVINPDSVYYCLYQIVGPLTATATGGATINWYDSNMNPLPGAPTPSTTILGATIYYVTQSLGVCASPASSITVFVVPGPNAAFTTNPSTGNILPGQSVTFTPLQQFPYYSYSWNFGDVVASGNTSTIAVPSHAYATAGTYCTELIIISAQTGCKDSSTLCLDVLNGVSITIPNVFTPNGDLINDVFSVKSEGIRDMTCDIYDRWGLKLSGWNGTTGYWDGTSQGNGKHVSDGTYYYIINTVDLKGTANTYKGYLQLLK